MSRLKKLVKKVAKPALLIGAAVALPSLAAKIGTAYLSAKSGAVKPGDAGVETVGSAAAPTPAPVAPAQTPASVTKPGSSGIGALFGGGDNNLMFLLLALALVMVVAVKK